MFTTKSPPFLLNVGALARHFRNARFLFVVRNPYAVCESICRALREPHARAGIPARHLPEAAAIHVATCLAWQRRNVEAYRERGVFFTYETMCAEPERGGARDPGAGPRARRPEPAPAPGGEEVRRDAHRQ